MYVDLTRSYTGLHGRTMYTRLPVGLSAFRSCYWVFAQQPRHRMALPVALALALALGATRVPAWLPDREDHAHLRNDIRTTACYTHLVRLNSTTLTSVQQIGERIHTCETASGLIERTSTLLGMTTIATGILRAAPIASWPHLVSKQFYTTYCCMLILRVFGQGLDLIWATRQGRSHTYPYVS